MNSVFKTLSQVERRDIQWIWNNRIPRKGITLLEGDGGVGKSFAIASIISDLTVGRPLPGSPPLPALNVLLMSAEDDPEVVLKPRYETLHADCDKIHFYDQPFSLGSNIEAIIVEIKKRNIELVVVDPIIAYLSPNDDLNKSTDVRSFMSKIHDASKQLNVAFLLIRHWNKNSLASASQRGSGSVDFRNASRSVLQIIKNGNERHLALEKTNYAAQAKTISFSIHDGCLKWGAEIDKSADELLSEANLKNSYDLGTKEEATNFLTEKLEKSTVAATDLIEEADQMGISKRTLMRAKKDLGIASKKISNVWYWDKPTLPQS